MKRFALMVLLCTAGLAICDEPNRNAEPAEAGKETATDQKPMSFWMEKKLDYSQGILRGLATGDFESIKSNAAQMNLLSNVEGFVRSKNPEYRMQLHTFNRISGEIARQAERENIEGVTLAFNLLTVSCVECHRTIRGRNNEHAVGGESPATELDDQE